MAAFVVAAAAISGHAAAQSQSTDSADARLWAEVQALAAPPASLPSDPTARFEAIAAQRERLLERARLYLIVYPGGEHREDAIRVELGTLYELTTLGRVPLSELRERLRHWAATNDPAARQEAAYWQILADRMARPPAADSQPLARLDASLAEAYRDYIRTYPASRYAPALASAVFEFGEESGQVELGREMLKVLEASHPSHTTTELLAARLRRRDAVGQKFALDLTTTEGLRVTTSQAAGGPLIVVAWAGFDRPSRRCVQEIEKVRSTHPALRVVGVSLEASREKLAADCKELGISWPQACDGMGWAGAFARQWGIDRLPMVFVIGPDGVLRGTCDDDSWREWIGGP